MAFFNESYTNQQLSILNEKKSREEYHRRSFKKKYNFEPDKPGSDTGKITVDGKKYDVDMRKYDNKRGKKTEKEISADTLSDTSSIDLGKKFFKLKGSNKSERRDAVLQHEIGHQNLHNINPANKTVDKKNRTEKVYDQKANNMIKNHDNDDRRAALENLKKAYIHFSTKDEDEIKRRNESLESAKKYEKNHTHTNAMEFEADRYAANKTSERAIKRGLRQVNKMNKKEFDDKISKSSAPKDDKKEINRMYKNDSRTDTAQRTAALKDNDLRKSDVYK